MNGGDEKKDLIDNNNTEGSNIQDNQNEDQKYEDERDRILKEIKIPKMRVPSNRHKQGIRPLTVAIVLALILILNTFLLYGLLCVVSDNREATLKIEDSMEKISQEINELKNKVRRNETRFNIKNKKERGGESEEVTQTINDVTLAIEKLRLTPEKTYLFFSIRNGGKSKVYVASNSIAIEENTGKLLLPRPDEEDVPQHLWKEFQPEKKFRVLKCLRVLI